MSEADEARIYRSRYAICDDCECVTIIERNDARGVPEEIDWEEFGRCLVCGGTLKYFDANPKTVDDTYYALGKEVGRMRRDELVAAITRVEALCARWDVASKGESATTRAIRAAITGD